MYLAVFRDDADERIIVG